jgi:hypothetical protein
MPCLEATGRRIVWTLIALVAGPRGTLDALDTGRLIAVSGPCVDHNLIDRPIMIPSARNANHEKITPSKRATAKTQAAV